MSCLREVQLGAFLQTHLGGYVLDWEQRQFDAVVADVFGYHALQLGLPELDALRENRMPLRFCAADRQPADVSRGTRVAVINRYEELPFDAQSIDLVVLPHVLEFSPEPHQVLREVERVLVPEGQVVITGFNPASLWGLRQQMSRLGMAPLLPAGQLIALSRAKDWLKLLSFEVNRGQCGCYVPAARSERSLKRWTFMERAGDRWWPIFGAVYMLRAVKRVRGMRLVGRVGFPRVRPALAPATIGTLLQTSDACSIKVRPRRDADNDTRGCAARG
jgi:SAM-dependent methyltransferase